jgi:hypothetical protein
MHSLGALSASRSVSLAGVTGGDPLSGDILGCMSVYVHRMNSKVYAARVTATEDGLFTKRAVRRGDILCQYTGTHVPESGDDPPDAQYLMHMLRRKQPDEDEEVTVTVDGRGELGGYANYADWRVANAIVITDVIRTVHRRVAMARCEPQEGSIRILQQVFRKRDLHEGG